MSFQSPKHVRKRLERRKASVEKRLRALKGKPKQAAYAEAALERINVQLERLDEKYDSPGKETGGE